MHPLGQAELGNIDTGKGDLTVLNAEGERSVISHVNTKDKTSQHQVSNQRSLFTQADVKIPKI